MSYQNVGLWNDLAFVLSIEKNVIPQLFKNAQTTSIYIEGYQWKENYPNRSNVNLDLQRFQGPVMNSYDATVI